MPDRFDQQSLREKVAEFIARHRLLGAGDRLGVAVSGGADSTALLRLLLEMRAELGIVLSVVHFNHQIRGVEADEDEQFVRSLAGHHRLEFHGGAGDVPEHAHKRGISLETAARELRYAYFRQLLDAGMADKIATAHTRDDQAETVLLRLLRGAGTKGLAGIYPELHLEISKKNELWNKGEGSKTQAVCPENDGRPLESRRSEDGCRHPAIVRPLLEIGRPEIETYLHGLNQPWREDRTNRDVRHARNRLRHTLLPLIEQEFNPAVRALLGETAEIARAEEAFWRRATADAYVSTKPHWWPETPARGGGKDMQPEVDGEALRAPGNASEVWASSPNRELHLSLPEFFRLPLALQRRVVRAATEEIGLALAFEHVEQIIRLAGGASGKQLELPASAAPGLPADAASRESGNQGWRASRIATCPRVTAKPGEARPSRPELVFTSAGTVTGAYGYVLPVPGQVRVPELGVRFTAALVSPEDGACIYNQRELADSRLFGAEVLVRNWQAGDRFQPAHSKSGRKVKELLQWRHVSGRERSLWPVVVDAAGELLWMRGFGVAQPALAAPQAEMALVIGEEPLPEEDE